MTFKIGDSAFVAYAATTQVWVVCPECLGSGRIRVILGDESEVSIPCKCCERGIEGSPGRIQTYEYVAQARPITITAVRSSQTASKEEVSYQYGPGYHADGEDVFETEAEAMTRANVRRGEYAEQEARRLVAKEKQHKTWAWNVSHYRQQLKRAQQQIEWYTKKLNTVPKDRKQLDAELKQLNEAK